MRLSIVLLLVMGVLCSSIVIAAPYAIIFEHCGFIAGDGLSCSQTALYSCEVNNTFLTSTNNMTFVQVVIDHGGTQTLYSMDPVNGGQMADTWVASIPLSVDMNVPGLSTSSGVAVEVEAQDSDHSPLGGMCIINDLVNANTGGVDACMYRFQRNQSYVSSCQCLVTTNLHKFTNNTCKTEYVYSGCAGKTNYNTSLSYCNFCTTQWVASYSACVPSGGSDPLVGRAIRSYSVAPGDNCSTRIGAMVDDTTPPADNNQPVVCRLDYALGDGKDADGSKRQSEASAYAQSYTTYTHSMNSATLPTGVKIKPLVLPEVGGVQQGNTWLVAFEDGSIKVFSPDVRAVVIAESLPGVEWSGQPAVWGFSAYDNGTGKMYTVSANSGVAGVFYNSSDGEYYFGSWKISSGGISAQYVFSISDEGSDAIGSGVVCDQNSRCFFVTNDQQVYAVNVPGGSHISANSTVGMVDESDAAIVPLLISYDAGPQVVAWVGTSGGSTRAFFAYTKDLVDCVHEDILGSFSLLYATSPVSVKSKKNPLYWDSTIAFTRFIPSTNTSRIVSSTLTASSFTGGVPGLLSWGDVLFNSVSSINGGSLLCVGEAARATCPGGSEGFVVPAYYSAPGGTGGGGGSPSIGNGTPEMGTNGFVFDTEVASGLPGGAEATACSSGVCYAATHLGVVYAGPPTAMSGITPSGFNSSAMRVAFIGSYGGNGYALISNDTHPGQGYGQVHVMKFVPGIGWSDLGVLSDSHSGGTQILYYNGGPATKAMSCWSGDGGGCSAGVSTNTWLTELNSLKTGFVYINSSTFEEHLLDSASCWGYPSTVERAVKVGNDFLFTDLSRVARITGGSSPNQACGIVDSSGGYKLGLSPLSSSQYVYAVVDTTSTATSVLSEGGYVINTGSIGGVLSAPTTWYQNGFPYNSTPALVNASCGSVGVKETWRLKKNDFVNPGANTQDVRTVLFGKVEPGCGLMASAPTLQYTQPQTASGGLSADGKAFVVFDVYFGSSYVTKMVWSFGSAGLYFPYMRSVSAADHVLPMTYPDQGGLCSDLESSSGPGCIPAMLAPGGADAGIDVTTLSGFHSDSNAGEVWVSFTGQGTGGGGQNYTETPVLTPYTEFTCYAKTNLEKVSTATALGSQSCTSTIAIISGGVSNEDEVLSKDGLFGLSNLRQIASTGVLGGGATTAVVAVDVNADTFTDFVGVTSSQIRTILSNPSSSVAYSKNLTAGAVTCRSVAGTIFSSVESVGASNPNDVLFVTSYSLGGQEVFSKTTYGASTSYIPLSTGEYTVSVSLTDQGTGENVVASPSCTASVIVPVVPRYNVTCELGADGEMNFGDAPASHGWRTAGVDPTMDGMNMITVASSGGAGSSLQRDLACDAAVVNVSLKMNATGLWYVSVGGDRLNGGVLQRNMPLVSVLGSNGQLIVYSPDGQVDAGAFGVGQQQVLLLTIDRVAKRLVVSVDGVSRASVPLGVDEDLSSNVTLVGNVSRLVLWTGSRSLGGGGQVVDWIRVKGVGVLSQKSTTGKQLDDLRGCVRNGDRNFSAVPVGCLRTGDPLCRNASASPYPHVGAYCSDSEKGKCSVEDLQDVVRMNARCYQEAYTYCIQVVAPNDIGAIDGADLTSGGVTCTAALQTSVGVNRVVFPALESIWGIIKNNFTIILMIIIIVVAVGVVGSRRR